MMASCSAQPGSQSGSFGVVASTESAFRDALTASIDRLELGDRNLLRFHYFHGLDLGQLADMFASHRPTIERRLAKIREQLLRDTRRGLAARLPLAKPELDHLLDLARARLDIALSRVLRA
jgi:RNA polymerase sigma-70 factor, ECF subfamily